MLKIAFVLCLGLSCILAQNALNQTAASVAPAIETVVAAAESPAVVAPVTPEIQEALQFSSTALQVINEYIQQKLPPAAQAEAQLVLDEAKAGLATCEGALQSPLTIWQYKVCGAKQLEQAMSALGQLSAHYYATSGAQRLGFFC